MIRQSTWQLSQLFCPQTLIFLSINVYVLPVRLVFPAKSVLLTELNNEFVKQRNLDLAKCIFQNITVKALILQSLISKSIFSHE